MDARFTFSALAGVFLRRVDHRNRHDFSAHLQGRAWPQPTVLGCRSAAKLKRRPTKQKDRPKAVSLYPNRAGDQATLSADPFCLRRYAMKPTPAKPRIIIAHVEGSGTAVVIDEVSVASPLTAVSKKVVPLPS
jgi:hypothetical protein